MDGGLLCLAASVLPVLAWGAWAIARALRQASELKARPGELKALAQRLNFTFVEVDPENTPSPTERTLFQAECGPPAMRLQGTLEGGRVELLESTVRRGGRVAKYFSRACFLFQLQTPWPRFVMQPERVALDPQDVDDSLKGCVAVEVQDDAFEEAFTLSAWNGQEVRGSFPPELRAKLVAEAQAGRAFTVESLGTVVVAWRDEASPTPQVLAQRLHEARAFVALVGTAMAVR